VRSTRPRADDDGAWLSIGALSRATGIAIETLRTWETRYGFPAPQRKPSGHRVYPVSAVPRLRRIAQVLALGHRAGQVVGASEEAVERLLLSSAPTTVPTPVPIPPSEDVPGLLRLIGAFDADRLTRVLLADWARTGPVDFLESRLAPLVRAVGDSWARGDLQVVHEHFLSEKVGDLLRSLRLPLEEKARGPLVLFATLSGERHGLGLQMAALVTAAAGCRVLYLGTDTPAVQVASLARQRAARAVGVSVSAATRGTTASTALRRLREALPRRVGLVVGGEGAPMTRPGIEAIPSLRGLDEWSRRLAGALSTPAGS
jgi:methanogenic corrinoid protein MtbC1